MGKPMQPGWRAPVHRPDAFFIQEIPDLRQGPFAFGRPLFHLICGTLAEQSPKSINRTAHLTAFWPVASMISPCQRRVPELDSPLCQPKFLSNRLFPRKLGTSNHDRIDSGSLEPL